MKSIVTLLISLQLFSIMSPAWANGASTSNEKKKFIVTAYYSPLPDQSFYLRGSYEADLLLNGNGTHGASGKAVYEGMLAAPKTYSFGTKIYFDGIGVGTVDDRGGAIVSSGSRGYDADRIDIWMGQWEEGLKRALTWGKRSITGKIIDQDAAEDAPAIDLGDFKIAKINPSAYKKQSVAPTDDDTNDIFKASITKSSDPEKIKELQVILSHLSYYDDAVDGKYSAALEGAIYDFQIENRLVSSKKDYGAGFYGAKTREKLAKMYARYVENEKKRIEEETRLAIAKAQEDKRKEAAKTEVALFVKNLGTPKADEVGKHVRSLQQTLKSLGYFSEKDTAIFGKNTKAALVSYQKTKNIDASEFGILGKTTKEALLKDLLALREKRWSGEIAFSGK